MALNAQLEVVDDGGEKDICSGGEGALMLPANDSAPQHRLISFSMRMPVTEWRDTLDEVREDAISGGYAKKLENGMEWDSHVMVETIVGGYKYRRRPEDVLC